MPPSGEPGELDLRARFGPGESARLQRELKLVADARVEEEGGRQGRWQLYARSVWRNRASILRTLLHSRAWELPARLGRLTTAAASALVVLLLTAEAWEVGARQPAGILALLSMLGVLGTSAYVLKRQRLLPVRRTRRPTEQSAVAHATLVLVVVSGIAITWGLLFLAALVLGHALVTDRILGRWVALPEGRVEWQHYASMAAFTAALGILIGAFGASFEGEHYVRHLAYVDEEL
jgi:hypothetical protein